MKCQILRNYKGTVVALWWRKLPDWFGSIKSEMVSFPVTSDMRQGEGHIITLSLTCTEVCLYKRHLTEMKILYSLKVIHGRWRNTEVLLTSTVENSERDGNTRPPDPPLEKSVCRSGSNSWNWTWNNRLIPNRKRSTSRLYIVTLLI